MTERLTLRVPVEYQDPPDELIEKMFSRSPHGRAGAKYHIMDVCKGIPLIPRELDIEIVDLGFIIHDVDRVVRELDAFGLRPTIYPEVKAFYELYREEGKRWDWFDLAGAGSYIEHAGAKYFPTFGYDPDSGYPYLSWHGGFGFSEPGKTVYSRFLATKK